MKLQFIECLRDKNFEEAQEYLDDLLELYPENSQFMKDFQKLLPTEIEHQKKEIEAEALLEAEAEAEEEEEEDEKEGDQPSAEEEESEDEEEEIPKVPEAQDKQKDASGGKDLPPKRSYFFVSTRG